MQGGKKIIVKMGAKKKNAGKKAGFKNQLVILLVQFNTFEKHGTPELW
jgi:hypothetical protein